MKLYEVPREEQDLAEEMAEAVRISLLPQSKAKNAYELCEEVCQAITEEPRRYDQSNWLMRASTIIVVIRDIRTRARQ